MFYTTYGKSARVCIYADALRVTKAVCQRSMLTWCEDGRSDDDFSALTDAGAYAIDLSGFDRYDGVDWTSRILYHVTSPALKRTPGH